jgi:hypothetical protein
VYLEIVDQPLNSFQNNVSILNNFVTKFDPEYSNYQIDLNIAESKYIFSLAGTCVLNSPNKETFNFIVSIRICLNFSNGSALRNDSLKLEELISVDFIKIKIFNSITN